MRTMSFDPKNKHTTLADYPKLKLGKDELARILCIEEPAFAWTHTLRAPTIINGKPKMVTLERRNGEEYEAYKFDFIGRPLCLGDEGILAEQGVDAKNCPACEMSKESDMTGPPERRFAMHVVRYTLKQGGFQVASPFSCQLMVWAYPDSIFNKLVDITTEWGSLREHDLMLGPCTNVDFQKFEIAVAKKAAWQDADPAGVDRRSIVVQTYKENQAKDLEGFCGRKVDRKFMIEDLEKIRGRWRVANAAEAGSGDDLLGDVGANPTLTEGLSGLMDDHSGGLDEFSSTTASTSDLSDLLSGSKPANTSEAEDRPDNVTPLLREAVKEDPALAKVTEKVESGAVAEPTAEPMSFEDLLQGRE